MTIRNTLWLTVLAIVIAPAAANAKDWSWNLSPYIWGASVSADVEILDREVFGGEVDFADLLDDTDFAAMVHLEGQRGKAGLFADLVTIDLGDEPRVFDDRARTIEAKSDLEMTILDFGAVWYPGGDGSGFGLHAGVRMIDVDQEIDIREVGALPTDRRIVNYSKTHFDGLLGVRYKNRFADGWSFVAWGDVAAGSTEGSWSAAAAFGYHFGEREQYAVRFGYRHLAVEVENEDRGVTVEPEIAMSGPMVGFTFAF